MHDLRMFQSNNTNNNEHVHVCTLMPWMTENLSQNKCYKNSMTTNIDEG